MALNKDSLNFLFLTLAPLTNSLRIAATTNIQRLKEITTYTLIFRKMKNSEDNRPNIVGNAKF